MNGKKLKTDYCVGDVAEGGAKIKSILGSTTFFIVFLNDEGDLTWESDDSDAPEHVSPCVAKFDELVSQVRHSVPSFRSKEKITDSLGRSLFSAVTSVDENSAITAFSGSIERVEQEICLNGRFHYVASSLVIALLICLFSWIAVLSGISNVAIPYVIGGCTGAVGAAMSVLLRGGAIPIPTNSTPSEHVFQGALRVFLGTVCGVALVIFIKAELVLGIARDNLPSIAAFALLAGFSERYIPSLLESLEGKTAPEKTVQSD